MLRKDCPLLGSTFTIGLHTFVVDELKGIAVVQIIVTLIRVGNHIIMQDEVGEYHTVQITDKTADHKQGIVAQIELDFAIWLQTPIERFVSILEFDFTSVDIEPFNVGFCKEN